MTTMSLSSMPFVFSEQETLLHIAAMRKRGGGVSREDKVGHLILFPEVVPGHDEGPQKHGHV